MDEDRIRQIIATLEANTESGNGKVRLAASEPSNEVSLTANRIGLLRLARTLLQAAIEPVPSTESRPMPLDVTKFDIEQARERPNDRLLAFVQRVETWPEPAEAIKQQNCKDWQRDKMALLGWGIATFTILFIFAAGVITIWQSLVR